MGRSTASGGGILRHPAQTVTPAVTDRQTQAAETSSKMMMLAWHAAVDAPQDRKEMGRCCRLAMTVASAHTLRLAGHLLIICAQNHLLETCNFLLLAARLQNRCFQSLDIGAAQILSWSCIVAHYA